MKRNASNHLLLFLREREIRPEGRRVLPLELYYGFKILEQNFFKTHGEIDKYFFLETALCLKNYCDSFHEGSLRFWMLLEIDVDLLGLCPYEFGNPPIWLDMKLRHYLGNGFLEFVFAILQHLNYVDDLSPHGVCIPIKRHLIFLLLTLVKREDTFETLYRYNDVLMNGLIKISTREDKLDFYLISSILDIVSLFSEEKRKTFYDSLPASTNVQCGLNPGMCRPIEALTIRLLRMRNSSCIEEDNLYAIVISLPFFVANVVKMAWEVASGLIIKTTTEIPNFDTRSTDQLETFLKILYDILEIRMCSNEYFYFMDYKHFDRGLPILMKTLVTLFCRRGNQRWMKHVYHIFHLILFFMAENSQFFIQEVWYSMYSAEELSKLKQICEQNPQHVESEASLNRIHSGLTLINNIENPRVKIYLWDWEHEDDDYDDISVPMSSECLFQFNRSDPRLRFLTECSILQALSWKNAESDETGMYFHSCSQIVANMIEKSWPDQAYFLQLSVR